MGSPASVTYGPGLMGTFINIFLFGIMVTQCFLYYSKYPKDSAWVKALVLLLLVADTLNCVFDMWWVYDILINHFNDLSALDTGNWIFATDPAMVGLISTIVQLFFAWRVKILTDNWWLVLTIVITAFASVFGGIGTAIAIHFVPRFVEFQKFQVIVIIWRICASVCDILITGALTWYLRKHRTGFSETDDVLNKITRLTVQNGLITSVWAFIDLVTYLATPSGLHLAFNFPLAKLYTNSLMSSLNSREGWRYKLNDPGNDITLMTRDGAVGARRLDVLSLQQSTRPEVYVTVESHEMVDTNKAALPWAESQVPRKN